MAGVPLLSLLYRGLGIAALFLATNLPARTLHVDASASGPGDGSTERPFPTISAAAAMVDPGDTVLIRPGAYREWVALERSGTAEAPITFEAVESGAAVISGADVLGNWEAAGEEGVFSVPWPHDFIIDTRPDGSLVRSHFGDPPLGCSEMVLWKGKPLTMVMTRQAMVEGSFHVDWEGDRLYLRLPGNAVPGDGEVEGAVRAYLFSPLERWNQFSDARHIIVRGLRMMNAANFPQRGGLVTGNDWLVENCLIEANSSGGVNVRGCGVTLKNVSALRNGFAGISGIDAENVLLDHCESAENNWRGFNPGNDGGGSKFVKCRNLRIIGFTSYRNTGPGIWLDYECRDYVIEHCRIFENRGLTMDWEGGGIDTEINPGPGRIANNTIFSNTGPGIGIWESRELVVEDNILMDNGANLEFRAMPGREYELGNVTIRRNRSGAWRKHAVATGFGEWGKDGATRRNLVLENNVYDAPEGEPFLEWARRPHATLQDAQREFGIEQDSELKELDITLPLVQTRTVKEETP